MKNIALYIMALTCMLACENKKPEHVVVEKKEIPLEEISSQVKIIPVMTSPIGDSNTVYCANIEYLWHAIENKSEKNISQNPLAKIFSAGSGWKNSMDTSKLILAFGKPEDVYSRVVKQYREKYKIDKTDIVPAGSSFWGYTDKMVNYKYAEPFDEQELTFLGTEVSAFGFDSDINSVYAKDYFKEQFDILYFNDNGEFVVKLNAANTTDEIILAMLKNRGTFSEMYATTTALIKKGESKLKDHRYAYNLNTEDELRIPVIRFKASRNYNEARGLTFSSAYGPIDILEQAIHFNFDRKGVALEAEVSVYDSLGAPQKPKMLLYNKPFYLYIKEAKASLPYFNLWVANTDILEKKRSIK